MVRLPGRLLGQRTLICGGLGRSTNHDDSDFAPVIVVYSFVVFNDRYGVILATLEGVRRLPQLPGDLFTW